LNKNHSKVNIRSTNNSGCSWFEEYLDPSIGENSFLGLQRDGSLEEGGMFPETGVADFSRPYDVAIKPFRVPFVDVESDENLVLSQLVGANERYASAGNISSEDFQKMACLHIHDRLARIGQADARHGSQGYAAVGSFMLKLTIGNLCGVIEQIERLKDPAFLGFRIMLQAGDVALIYTPRGCGK
jgi:hypothetical protein